MYFKNDWISNEIVSFTRKGYVNAEGRSLLPQSDFKYYLKIKDTNSYKFRTSYILCKHENIGKENRLKLKIISQF